MIRRVHLIESGGRGGVFNHTVEVAAGLTALGVDVVVHTADDCDEVPASVALCRCVTWHRASPNRVVRQARTSARYLLRTLPHLHRAIGPEDVVHIQGMFALTPELVSVARRRGATVVASPHNTFVRSNAPGGGRALRSALHDTDRVLVYSDADRQNLLARGVTDVVRVPLVQWIPPVNPALVERWRTELKPAGGKLALLPGQVRADKNPELFVQAMAQLPDWRGAVVGDDLGPGRQVDALIEATGAAVTTAYRYLDVDEFTALVASADVVVAPYAVASQSGVLAVAARLGVPTAVAPCGGLGELATAVARDTSVAAIRDAIVAAHQLGAEPVDTADAANRFLHEYTATRQRRTNGPARSR
ncbi:glycosyltransferase family 4 protein [Micromonospora soli]|uniref:glycosyltransferase family 4 protein n=1 Tax=Micromonospora sp. NBRC 110009 TaxID=3061627 RepID=UPI00267295A7|nr:glycosyltransferase family 4 protein [Micromonospora sp. NBRC 110009]WKT99793.1 glycosyltransferase family 4 protein [Micromonospora sp. NBRC 110009]